MAVTRNRRTAAAVSLLVVLSLLVAACSSSAGTPASRPPSASARPSSADPLALVGLWKLTDATPSEPGEVLRLGDDLTIWRRCGIGIGGWRAGHDGTFEAYTFGGSQSCKNPEVAPAWLLATRSFVIHGAERWLLNARGGVTAKLLPGGKPVVVSTVSPRLAEPPTLTASVRTLLAAPKAPTGGGSVPTRAQLIGRWVPYRMHFPAGSKPFAAFANDGNWTGSDGCNAGGGRWTLGPNGTLYALVGASTLIGCTGSDVPSQVYRARTVRLQAGVLSLFDDGGHLVSRLAKA